MKIGNRKELDAAREALRDQFDAIWLASETIGDRERRAIRCAFALDAPRHKQGSWVILPFGRYTAPEVILA